MKASISELIEKDAEKRGDGTSLIGTFLRLAWHCCGTYSALDHTGGSNGGRMRFKPESDFEANAGLGLGRGVSSMFQFSDLGFVGMFETFD